MALWRLLHDSSSVADRSTFPLRLQHDAEADSLQIEPTLAVSVLLRRPLPGICSDASQIGVPWGSGTDTAGRVSTANPPSPLPVLCPALYSAHAAIPSLS